MANDKIYIDFTEIFNVFAKRVDLKARNIGDELAEKIVVPDSYKDDIKLYFNECVAELQNDIFTFERLRNFEGTLRYEVTDEQQDSLLKKAKPLFEKTLIQYLMYAWFDAVSAVELSMEAKRRYMQYKADLSHAATTKKVTSRPYRPYW